MNVKSVKAYMKNKLCVKSYDAIHVSFVCMAAKEENYLVEYSDLYSYSKTTFSVIVYDDKVVTIDTISVGEIPCNTQFAWGDTE